MKYEIETQPLAEKSQIEHYRDEDRVLHGNRLDLEVFPVNGKIRGDVQ